MKFISIFLAILSIVILMVSIIIPFCSNILSIVESELDRVTSIISYLSLIFAAVALFIAVLAYNTSVKNPDLELICKSRYNDKTGFIVAVDKNTMKVSPYMPLTAWYLELKNKGDATAKFPVVQILFEGAGIGKDRLEGWRPIYHRHGIGNYQGIIWDPQSSVVVHPKFDYNLPTLYLTNELTIDNPENLKVNITLAADSMKMKNYSVPIKIEWTDT